MKIVKIESDGTPIGTKVFTEDGKELENIHRIKIDISPNEGIITTIDIYNVPIIKMKNIEANIRELY